MVMPGINVISKSTTIMAPNIGSNGLITFSIFTPATLHPIKSTDPTGGVHNPTHRLSTIMIPKCTGSMPNCCVAIGRKIGVKINTAGVMSINTPTTNRIALMSSKITIGFSLTPSNRLLTV